MSIPKYSPPNERVELFLNEAEKQTPIPKSVFIEFSKALLAERAEREKNPGVFDGAPECANQCTVYYARKIGKISDSFRESKAYTRELPKTKAREYAERIADEQTKYGVERWQDQKAWLLKITEDAYNAGKNEAAILEAQKDGAK